jgi:hypothetical protein
MSAVRKASESLENEYFIKLRTFIRVLRIFMISFLQINRAVSGQATKLYGNLEV